MPFQDQIIEFIEKNWETIIITLFFGSLFLILSSIALFRYIISAKRERQKQAKNDLIKIIEQYIIKKRKLDLQKINQLMNAAEDKHSIVIESTITPITLLEDVLLRIEESTHLSLNKKKEYASNITETISEILDEIEKTEMPKALKEIFDSLKKHIKANNTDEAFNDLKHLSKSIKKEPKEIKYEELLSPNLMPYVKLTIFLIEKFRNFQEKHPKMANILGIVIIIVYLIFFFWLIFLQSSP